MTTGGHERLRQIRTFPQLVKYLRDELDWPIESEGFEDLTYEYEPEELGLDEQAAVKVRKIHQLRPLASNQPWGIFFLDFEPKRLPVVVLRKILSALVVKKRKTAARAQRASWQLHDLLFISSYGEGEHRDLTFAHFSEDPDSGDLPALRVLDWDDEDTVRHLQHAQRTLEEKLRWPKDEGDLASWQQTWAEAFTLKHREAITTSKALAERLAECAKAIRKRVNAVLRVESDKGGMRKLMASFKEALIHGLTEDDFADACAQTITYGLLAARVSRPAGLVAENITDMVPSTNPFLRDLLAAFLKAGGRRGKLDFDELGVNDVVELLRAPETKMEAVLRDFDDRNPQEDPVIHFYELFLKEYDGKKRIKRGVFFTPRPVVSFIVRSVDEILKTEFSLEDGLADTTTWAEMIRRHPDLKLPEGANAEEPFVQILDPACGTGTFLVEVIGIVHQTMLTKWRKQGRLELELPALWNDYVSDHLLPRLYGFELMMAPYAIAHMKIGLKLGATGYGFGSNVRTRIYLTNTLEPPHEFAQRILLDAPALAHEGQAVSAVKQVVPFTVIVGNPPYAANSANKGAWATDLVRELYYPRDDSRERNPKLLLDDYVKFICFAQSRISKTGAGTVAMITNHGYLDNPTFRAMRHSLVSIFSHVHLIDLHGNANKREAAPDGSIDKNVFDIRQGVAICLFGKTPTSSAGEASAHHMDVWGTTERKYKWLAANDVLTTPWQELSPQSPACLLVAQDTTGQSEYDSCEEITRIMPLHSTGVKTHRDHFVFARDRHALRQRIERFRDVSIPDIAIAEELRLANPEDWGLARKRAALAANQDWEQYFASCLLRPFDIMQYYHHDLLVDRPRHEVMDHLLAGENVALVTTRQTRAPFAAFVTRTAAVHKCITTYDTGYVFPLHLYAASVDELGAPRLIARDQKLHEAQERLDAEGGDASAQKRLTASIRRLFPNPEYPRWPNLDPLLLADLGERVGLKFVPDGTGHHQNTFGPGDVFNYIYAILHSPTYRERYAEFLKRDFPRIPFTSYRKLFATLAEKGAGLVALHLLESPKVDDSITTYAGPKDLEVGRVSWSDETVWLDAATRRKSRGAVPDTIGFCGVPEAVWDFHIGGYQVCERWLKDRRGRVLTDDDIAHYQKIIVAISETIRIMAEIDEVIEEHGGWPDAFVTTGTSL